MKIDRIAVYNKYDGHCSYCGKEITIKEMQVDHFIPKANRRPIARDMQGNYIYTDINAFENLMPSCRRCNHYKRAEPLEYFRILIKELPRKIDNFYIAKVAKDYGIIIYTKWDEKFYFERQNNERENQNNS